MVGRDSTRVHKIQRSVRNPFQNLVTIAVFVAVSGVASSSARGQCYGSSIGYSHPFVKMNLDGFRNMGPRFEITINISTGVYCRRTVLHRPGFVPIIEGVEGELEPIESDEAEIEQAPVEMRIIDFARALMAGELSQELLDRMSEGSEFRFSTRQQVVESAIQSYELHLGVHPEDRIAMRELSIALIEGNRIEDALQLMLEVYSQDPELGILPLKSGILGESGERLRKMVVRMVQHAHREPSDRAWLAVSVLMQAQGRTELAGEMLDRAVELGLDAEIEAGIRKAIG